MRTTGRTALGLVFLAGVLASAVWLYLWPWHAEAARCRTAYASTRTAAETAAVDTVHMPVPSVSKHLETLAQTERCEALVRSKK